MLLCPNAVQFSPFVCVTDTTLHTSADQNAEVSIQVTTMLSFHKMPKPSGPYASVV